MEDVRTGGEASSVENESGGGGVRKWRILQERELKSVMLSGKAFDLPA